MHARKNEICKQNEVFLPLVLFKKKKKSHDWRYGSARVLAVQLKDLSLNPGIHIKMPDITAHISIVLKYGVQRQGDY